MYAKLKKLTESYPWAVPVIVAILCIACIWIITERRSQIDTTGIRNAETELQRSIDYNRQSIDYNQRARAAVESGQVINERIESAVNRSVKSNQRTEEAVDRSTELATRAREDAIRAKALIGESRNILESAERRAEENQIKTTEQHTP